MDKLVFDKELNAQVVKDEPASPENPIPTNTGKEFHPTRADFNREKLRQAWKKCDRMIAGTFQLLIDINNSFAMRDFWYAVLFCIWFLSFTIITFLIPASLNLIYIQQGCTFDLGVVSGLLDVMGVLLFRVFPAYILVYVLLINHETFVKPYRKE